MYFCVVIAENYEKAFILVSIVSFSFMRRLR